MQGMPIALRPALPEECPSLSALCRRSKAHWGYDAAFMEACRDELTVHPEDEAVVAELDGVMAGTAQVHPHEAGAELAHFFVDPPFMGQGVGRALFGWCTGRAQVIGATRLLIDADPQAQPFYEAMGAIQIGTSPSASIPGRMLPLLEYRIR